MQAITGIAFNQADHDTDDFGKNDDDWNIYIQAVRDHPHPCLWPPLRRLGVRRDHAAGEGRPGRLDRHARR